VDSGVYSGFQITPYYDALIAKLIVHEDSRGETITRMKRALEEYRIIGVRTNIPLHQALMENPDFLAGEFDTQFLQDDILLERGTDSENAFPEIAALVAALATHQGQQASAVHIKRGKSDLSNWKLAGRRDQIEK
jgi:acetyl/propionyl-CoA carboxylase alpha subunit